MKIKLYDYQEIAYQKVIRALDSVGIALMVMATGLGKTIVSAVIARFFLSSGSGKRILFLSHDNGILEQSYLKYKDILGEEYSCARFFGKKKNWNADKHDIVFATFQSKPHKFFKADHFDFIIVDESHHSKADTYFSTLNYFTPAWKLGMTATPDREDERDIRSIFGKEVVDYDLPEAMANGWLTPVDYKILTDGMDLEMLEAICQEVLVENVRISESQLNERIFIRTRSDEQCKQILDYTQNGLKAIVFCSNITHLDHIMELLPNSVAVHSGRTDDENDEAEIMYRTGRASHILVVDKYNEGKDLPDTDVLVFLRTTDSYRIWVQQLGRGLRLFPGKDKVIILDFVANIERVKNVHSFAMKVKEYGGGGINHEFKLDTPLHLEGKNFSFDFSSELVNLMSVFEKVSLFFYSTWPEAGIAALDIGITGSDSYDLNYKNDYRLPSSPISVYPDFPGWEKFLQKKIPPNEWISSRKLRNLLKVSGSNKIESFLVSFRISNPEWFGIFWSHHKYCEHYHPDLVNLILSSKRLKTKGLPPDGWNSATKISLELDSSPDTFLKFVEQFRISNPELFGEFAKPGIAPTEYFSPELAKSFGLFLKPRNSNKPLDGWITPNHMEKNDKIASCLTIKNFVEQFRISNPEWFKVFFHRTLAEYYHPDLVKKIKEKFGSHTKAPDGWITMNVLYKSLNSSPPTIFDLVEPFRHSNPEWFGLFRTRVASSIEHYHPDLVQKVKEKFVPSKRQSNKMLL